MIKSIDLGVVSVVVPARGSSGSSLPGPDSTSIAAMIARFGAPRSVLTLRDIPRRRPVADWFLTLRPLEGGRNDSKLIPDAFDAVLFIDTVHPAVPLR